MANLIEARLVTYDRRESKLSEVRVHVTYQRDEGDPPLLVSTDGDFRVQPEEVELPSDLTEAALSFVVERVRGKATTSHLSLAMGWDQLPNLQVEVKP